ncbi:MAG: hypothetical protein COU85_02790 [Candidatus Portnoybacteria bacterium CG10_big_fil_rev_8_21_14_0_10_44_7]|uniref:Uncharacterized protein n=1 Tax=Candidatus Portnoybacteria bacterium CG10_big_fil_rev_8_21_14_0_10_44_7 TaxID=1974816 RepID=A0A2M8KI67_9BACT|nr:MAG: hypothetical protein COU85_02790 [Candidatus Portnoybacteria bacterium CG10_big_fil_rev_8_21_14_0_10_44_7]
MEIEIIKKPISRDELQKIAKEQFGDLVKVVVDVRQQIMAVGGELHADGETALMEKENSQREDTWGINLYSEKTGAGWLEFDSMINLKPAQGNRSRGVESPQIQSKIKKIVDKLIS